MSTNEVFRINEEKSQLSGQDHWGLSRHIPISFFYGTNDNQPKHNSTKTWVEVGALLESYSQETFPTKEAAPLFAATIYSGKRAKLNATICGMFAIDVDERANIAEVNTILREDCLEAISYTSSHNQAGERFRVVIPLSENTDALTCERTVLAFRDYLANRLKKEVGVLAGQFNIDTTKQHPFSMFYVPGQYECAEDNQFHYIEGEVLSSDQWLDLFPQPIVVEKERQPFKEFKLSIDAQWNPYETDAWSEYQSLSADRYVGLFGLMTKLAMSAINHLYEITDSELADLADEAQRGNPPSSQSNHRTPAALLKEAGRAIDEARGRITDPVGLTQRNWAAYGQGEPWKCGTKGVASLKEMLEDLRDDPPDREDMEEQTQTDPTWDTDEDKSEPEKIKSQSFPIDIWGETFSPPELTRDMLPEVIANYAWDEAARIGVDPACVAIPCLIICAAGLHDMIRIQPMKHNTRWTERACLWGGFISPPSGRKTAGLDSAREPAKIVEREWRKQDQISLAKYIQEHDAWKASSKKAIKDGGEVEEEPQRPPLRRICTTDYTMESLEDILIDNERGILIFNDELVGFITGLDAYKASKGKDRSAALELFNGGDRAVDRKGSYRFVPNWSACVAGGIQDDKLKQVAGGLAVDGMLQRFLMFRSGLPYAGEDRHPNMDAIRDYLAMYQTLVCQNEDQIITLSDEAHIWREEVFKIADAYAIDASLSPAFRTHVGKIRGIFPRLLLTLHAIEAHPKPIGCVVAGDTARRARDLIVEFFIPHELAIYADLFDHQYEAGKDMQWIAGHILAHSFERFKDRDIYRSRQTEFLDNRRRLENALRGLWDLGWIEPDREPKLGKVVWTVNPLVHSQYRARAEQECRTRLQQQEQIVKRRSMTKTDGE